ncbi:beta strand repeat-containing protein [Pararcticibacter amylolyticus]|uniref:Phage tail collar domain-containing protein n=1 Tax=Pararcticibacter amylolyticus TaxID=2173175 RepID=A0A2U2PD26_9SPHI|nr:hypothetical protein [Pararcticibacter amylolyticus]PWG79214.1 hypothetical protein DDR33_18170 [Pararcticibacter amylolyticus]
MKNSIKFYKCGVAAAMLFCSNVLFAQQKYGDNLGSHQATRDLNMNSHRIDSVSVLNAQGAVIGTAAAVNNHSVALQVNGNDKAILIPRVANLLDAANPAIVNAVEGMIVYDLTTGKFYVRNNFTWVTFAYTNLADGKILVGDATGTAAAVTLSGDITLDRTGLVSIVNGKVTTSKLADQAVTAVKAGLGAGNNKVLTTDATGASVWIDRSQFVSSSLSSGQIVLGDASNRAQTVTLSGDVTLNSSGVTAIGASKVVNSMLADNAVSTGKLADGSITSSKVVDGSITSVKLSSDAANDANRAVTTNHIRNNAVTSSKLASDASTDANRAVTTDHIRDNAVVAAKIADNAVTVNKIADANVTVAKLATGGTDDANKVYITDAFGTPVLINRSEFVTSALPSAYITVGNASGVATATALTGDAKISNAGALTIGNNAITSLKLASDASTDANRAVSVNHIKNNAVTSAKLSSDANTDANRAVTTNHIRDNAVTSAKLASDASTDANRAVGTDHIKDQAVSAAKLADAAITTVKIANANVTMAKLATAGASDGNKVYTTDESGTPVLANRSEFGTSTLPSAQIFVGNASGVATAMPMSGDAGISNTGELAIGSNAVTSSKLASDASIDANRAVTTQHIRNNAVTSSKLSSDASIDAYRAVSTNHIKDNAVTSDKLAADGSVDANRAVTANHIRNNAVSSAKLSSDASVDAYRAVTTNHVRDKAITSAKLAWDGSVDANRAVTTDHIRDNAVTTVKIADQNVTTPKISDVAVTTAKIADAAVTTVKIADANVTLAKLGTEGLADANKVYMTDASGKAALSSTIDAARVANGSVTNTEFQSLSGITRNIQEQMNALTVGLVPVGSVVAWFPNLLSSATLSPNFVECNGQVLNDTQSVLNGITIPNLNSGSYLTGSSTGTGGTVGNNSTTLTASNLPGTSLPFTTSATTAGTPSGTISVSGAGEHSHSISDVMAFSLEGWSGKNNGGDGEGWPINQTSSAGYHTHNAYFYGSQMAPHSHTGSVNLNSGTQTAIDNRPQSFTVRWIMRVK